MNSSENQYGSLSPEALPRWMRFERDQVFDALKARGFDEFVYSAEDEGHNFDSVMASLPIGKQGASGRVPRLDVALLGSGHRYVQVSDTQGKLLDLPPSLVSEDVWEEVAEIYLEEIGPLPPAGGE